MRSTTDPGPGVRRTAGRGQVDSFGAGRTCADEGCATKLSQYNDVDVCWLHEQSQRSSGARPAARRGSAATW